MILFVVPSRLSYKQPLSGFGITKEEFAIAYKYEKTIKASAYVYWKRTWNERKAAVLSYFLKELEKIVYNRIINTLIKKTYFIILVCFYTFESTRKPLVFNCFHWLQKETSRKKLVTKYEPWGQISADDALI